MVDWPTSRQSRGRKRQERKESHQISTTQLVLEAGKYSDKGFTESECFDDKTGNVKRSFNPDRSLTVKEHLRMFGQTLLTRGNPFSKQPKVVREGKSGRKVPDRWFNDED